MMQLMPETAEWISEESGLPADDLNRPDENIPLGAWYLNFLLKKYHNNEVLALAAYNAGRGNVDEWVEKYNWGEGFSKDARIREDGRQRKGQARSGEEGKGEREKWQLMMKS